MRPEEMRPPPLLQAPLLPSGACNAHCRRSWRPWVAPSGSYSSCFPCFGADFGAIACLGIVSRQVYDGHVRYDCPSAAHACFSDLPRHPFSRNFRGVNLPADYFVWGSRRRTNDQITPPNHFHLRRARFWRRARFSVGYGPSPRRLLGNTYKGASQGRSACKCKWPAAAAPVSQRASSRTRAG